MRRSPFALVHACLAVAALALSRATEGIARAATAFLDLVFPTQPMRLMPSGPMLDLELGGHAVDAASQQGLRHEAGVARRAAERHT